MKPYLREREKESKVSTVTGIVLTVAVHVLACLLFVFSGLKYIYPPPQEQTFVIDFQEEEQPVRRQTFGRQPQAEEVDRTKPIELIQRSESPAVSQKENKTAIAKPDEHGDVEVPAPKEEINQNALFPGMSKKDSSLAPHGAEESSATYKAGHPKVTQPWEKPRCSKCPSERAFHSRSTSKAIIFSSKRRNRSC